MLAAGHLLLVSGVSMSAPFWIFGLGTTGVLGYVFMNGTVPDPSVYNMTPAELRAELKAAKTTYRSAGSDRHIFGDGLAGDRVKVSFANSGNSMTGSSCFLDFEPIDEGSTRIVADCGQDTESAQERTTRTLAALEVREHVDSVLRDRPFDYAKVIAQGTVVMKKNMKGMQAEALEMHDRLDATMKP